MSTKDVLSSLPATVTGLVAFSFTLTALREWAYHYAIGADFIILNSPIELASNALRWMPGIGLLIVLSFLFDMLTSRIEGFRSEEEIAEASSNPRRTSYLRILPYRIGLLLLIVGGFINAVYKENPQPIDWFLPLGAVWICFTIWYFRHPNNRLTPAVRLVLVFVPFWGGFSFVHGYDEALKHLALSRGEYRIVQSNDLTEDNVHLLRATSKGILVLRLATKDVSFLTYDSFKRIDWTATSAQEQELTPSEVSSGRSLTP